MGIIPQRIMSISDIARAIKTTIPGAHYVLKPLIKYGVVVRVGQYKSVRYTIPVSSKNF